MSRTLVIENVSEDEVKAARTFFDRFNTQIPEPDRTKLQGFLAKFDEGAEDYQFREERIRKRIEMKTVVGK